MKILYHHRTQAKGGEGVHIREIIKSFRSLGHEVVIVSPPGIDVFSDVAIGKTQTQSKKSILQKMWFWVSKHAPQILFEFFEIGYNVFIYVKISLILKDQKIDLIFERNAFFLFSTALISKKTKVPMILEVNEIVGIKRQRNQIMVPLARLLEQYVFKRASSIIVVSDFLKSELVKRGVEGKNILVLPNAVNPDDFNVEITGEEIRSKYLLSDKVVLVFMGTFSKWDNFDFLLGNFKELVLEYPNVCLLIIGDGQERSAIESFIRTNSLDQSVFMVGRVPRDSVAWYIAAADICVIPDSNNFGSPIVLFEYMAMGKPVIAPNIGTINCVIVDGESGVLFNARDEQSFRAKIIRLINDVDYRKSLGKCGQNEIMARYTWKNNTERIIAAYEYVKRSI